MVEQTSIKAYKELKEEGKLGERQEEVFKALKRYQPCTARELHEAMIERGNIGAIREGPNYVKPRLTELKKDQGLVKEKGTKKCSVTERTAKELIVKGGEYDR